MPVRPKPGLEAEYRGVLDRYAGGMGYDIVWLERGLEQIETSYDDAYTAPLVAERVAELWRSGYSGVLINCFDDPGLEAARELVPIPVMGAGLASYIAASMVADRFAVITVGGGDSVRVVRARARSYGFEGRLAAVYTIGLHVRELEEKPVEAAARVAELARRAWREDGAEAVILGCTGLTPLAERVERLLGGGIPVIDPTVWGFLLLKAMVEAGVPNPFFHG